MHNPTDTGTNKRCPICDAWSCSCAKDPPTDAAAASLAGEFYRIMWPITHDPICDWSECSPDVAVVCKNLARHVLTRQPGPEDMDRIGTFAHAPTRSALDSAFDPMFGNTPVRKAVVDAVLGLFESARRPLTETDVVRIAKSATNIRAARNGGYKMWTDLPDYIHAERAQFTRDILTAASWPMPTTTDSAASDRLAWLEKTHTETMDQNAQLIVGRDALNARIATLEAELAAARLSEDVIIANYNRLLLKPAATPPPGTIRLGEGLTEAPHGYAAVAEAMRMAEQTTTLLREVMRTRALRASTTPKPEPVDWEAIGKTYVEGDESAYGPPEIIRGLVDKIAALRAGGV